MNKPCYKVIAEPKLSELEKIITSHIEAGFIPVGGIAKTEDCYIQAVYYKPEND